ncbi:MAG TPA: T9SS type A sorting domain-containing protein [Candidatus Krumholzibacteria bacterium]|nr:T9SS type A sorting domain-containing protein [Candidatus Krumholzibacteria bacterium]
MKRLSTALIAAVLLMAALVAGSKAATITINNLDGAGEGFNDPTAAAPVGGNYGTTIGQQRLIAFTFAADIWGACLQSAVPIVVNAQMNPLTCNATSAVLGSAGTVSVFRDFPGALQAGTWYCGALANAMAGVDLDPANPDINAQFNSNIGNVGCLTGIFWYYGLDGNAPAGTIDFVSVVLHEIGHGIGFQTFVSQAGAKFLGFNDQYMVFLENHGAVPPNYPSMTDAQRAAANIADPNLHWTGPLVTAEGAAILSGGISNGHVRMHGPNPYQPGSSVSHWSTALTPNELMEPVYTTPIHDPGLAWTLMDEIGWTLQPKLTAGCDGSTVDMAPPTGAVNSAPDINQERGVYVTALKDFNLCSVGMEGEFIVGENITARVYAATGTTRGALLASNTVQVEFAGMRTHHIPLNYSLQKCKEYDITVQFNHTVSWPYWSEFAITEPYDIGGVIRVRDGELFGGAGNSALAHFTLQGSSPSAQNVTSLSATNNCTGYPNEMGAFATIKRTMSICKLGGTATFVASPTTVRAYVYNAAGNVRGSLVSEGTTTVGGTGLLNFAVPINAVLKEGQQYDIGFVFDTPTILNKYCHIEAAYPYEFSDLWTINILEVNGGANGNTGVPAFQVSWNEGPGLNPLDITAPWLGAPQGTGNGPFAFGKYIHATHNQEFTGMGFYADLPAGATLVANVYHAAGTVRGALMSTGTVTTGPTGLRWHDIPASASLVSGQDYDIEIDWTGAPANSFPFWTNIAFQPYNAYGLFDVVVGEFGGIPDGLKECAQFRVYSCATGSLTAAGPTVTPKFALHDAYPNPFSGSTTLGFDLDVAAPVTVTVYDVAGRRVADVVKSRAFPAGPGELHFDAGTLASGVYFVKLSTPSKSVTRKITIVR